MRFFAGCLVAIGFFMTEGVWGKDLASRLGVGYANQSAVSGGLSSLAVKYYPSSELALAAVLGVDTEKDNSKFGFGAKVMRTVFPEDNMNFYLGASAGLISQEEGGSNSSGFGLGGFGGMEFFLSGLESLGFSFEMGVGVASISSEVRFRTIGEVGVIFYF